MNKKIELDLEKIRREIAIERLRQVSSTIKISFGMSNGKFLGRDELIKNIQDDTPLGKNIVRVQLAYLKAFKERLLVSE